MNPSKLWSLVFTLMLTVVWYPLVLLAFSEPESDATTPSQTEPPAVFIATGNFTMSKAGGILLGTTYAYNSEANASGWQLLERANGAGQIKLSMFGTFSSSSATESYFGSVEHQSSGGSGRDGDSLRRIGGIQVWVLGPLSKTYRLHYRRTGRTKVKVTEEVRSCNCDNSIAVSMQAYGLSDRVRWLNTSCAYMTDLP